MKTEAETKFIRQTFSNNSQKILKIFHGCNFSHSFISFKNLILCNMNYNFLDFIKNFENLK